MLKRMSAFMMSMTMTSPILKRPLITVLTWAFPLVEKEDFTSYLVENESFSHYTML